MEQITKLIHDNLMEVESFQRHLSKSTIHFKYEVCVLKLYYLRFVCNKALQMSVNTKQCDLKN